MPKKEWIADYNGHQIRVTNAWFGGAKLYVDGDCRDTSNELVASPSRPTLSALISEADGSRATVEVFIESRWTVKAKICVNGKQIAGDVF